MIKIKKNNIIDISLVIILRISEKEKNIFMYKLLNGKMKPSVFLMKGNKSKFKSLLNKKLAGWIKYLETIFKYA